MKIAEPVCLPYCCSYFRGIAETGLPEVDEQHFKLVSILNHLASYLTKNVEEDELLKLFDELVNYTVYHFGTEEAQIRNFDVDERHVIDHLRASYYRNRNQLA